MELPPDISTLHSLIRELIATNQALRSRVESLELELKELRAQLSSDSKNSHRPPSSDGYRKRAALPKKKKKRGGQSGHRGSTLKMVAEPDQQLELRPRQCRCGTSLNPDDSLLVERRQVFDLPDPKLEVIEYQQYAISCPCCGELCKADFPLEVRGPVQYGSRVKAFAVLLSNSFSLSYSKISQLFDDLYGYPINGNTLFRANKDAYEALAASEQAIKDQLCQAEVAHGDESGLRIEGKLQWVHSLSSEKLTYLFIHPKRGRRALESEHSLLPKLSNWLVHDCWASYFPFEGVKHALCGAHILRELQALTERKSHWAEQMQKLLIDLYIQSHRGTDAIKATRQIQKRFERICYGADLEEPEPIPRARGRPKTSKGRNLLNRLIKYQDALLAFAFHNEVPFTNNLAERDIRTVKLKQKVAGCFRTTQGAKYYARIQGFISTARKNQQNTFKQLKGAFAGNTFLTQST